MTDWDNAGGGHQVVWGRNSGGTEYVLPIDDTRHSLKTTDQAIVAAFAGSGVCRWKNAVQVGAGTLVGTFAPSGDQPGIYYDLSEGETVMVTRSCVELETVADWVAYEVGYTSGTAGGGTFTPITPRHFVRTGSAFAIGMAGNTEDYYPHLRVAYSAGTAECVTMRTEANDAGAEVTLAWSGYRVS